MKRSIQHCLAAFGYRITKINQPANQPAKYPVEFDEEDRSIFEYVMSNKLTMVGFERLVSTLLACKYVCTRGVDGHFVECGVWRGGNSIIAADVFSRLMPSKQVYLFDTFAGMTEPTDIDRRISSEKPARQIFLAHQRETHNEWCYSSLEDVVANFDRRGLTHKAKFIKGDVLETLEHEQNLPEKISVLKLDTDWYESTKRELEVLWSRLQEGGILIIDDYGYWKGVKSAVDEFFGADRPYLHCVDDTSRVAIK